MTAGRTTRDPALTKVVERQMRNWELSRSQRYAVPETQRKEVADFITISRAVGAGGDEAAVRLGQRLGWPVFDRELLDVMAGDDELRRQIYGSMDERDVGWVEEMLRSLAQPGFAKNDYFHRLTETVLTLARQGHAVFLGRGVDLILPRGIGLRMRLTAPFDTCVDRVARERGLSRPEAKAEVTRLEAERGGFIHQHFGREAGEATRYDVVLNLARFGVDATVDLILCANRKLSACSPA